MNTYHRKHTQRKTIAVITLSLLALFSLHTPALAAEKTETEEAQNPEQASPELGERVDVSKVQKKYWAQGKDTELGVVQNRKYTSAHRMEFSLLMGSTSTDPFLSVKHLGGSIGYHFSQYLSLHALAWKAAASPSDAYRAFEAQRSNTSATVATNAPKAFYALQGNFNFLYGKASLFGSSIIYVDLFALGGLGVNDTSTGKYFSPFIGLGQKIHLNSSMALHLDYRLMHFNEKIESSAGLQERSNTTSAVTLGLSFFVN